MKYLTLNRAPFRTDLDRLFDDFWGMPARAAAIPEARWQPAAEIEEGEEHYLLALEVPGLRREDLKIEVEQDRVTVTGERKPEATRKNGLYSERRFGAFSRSFTLPTHVDTSRIEAQYADGVLKVYIPKAESAKPRVVPVGEGGGSFGKQTA